MMGRHQMQQDRRRRQSQLDNYDGLAKHVVAIQIRKATEVVLSVARARITVSLISIS